MSETKTATVKAVIGVREWQGNNGTVWYHKIELDNGDTGTIGKKRQDSIKPGDSITYTLEASENGNKIRAVQPNNNFNRPFAPKAGTASFALSYAKDIAVANINKSDKPIEMDGLANKIITSATVFQKWLKENE